MPDAPIDAYDQQAHLLDARNSVTESAPAPGRHAGYRPNVAIATDQAVDEFLGDRYVHEIGSENMSLGPQDIQNAA